MKKEQIRVIAEIAVLVGIAFVVDLLAGLFSPFPYGGSISPAMLPIFIIAYRRGWQSGMLAGFIFAVLQIVTTGTAILAWIPNPTPLKIFASVMLDYIFPFTMLGVAGFFKDPLKNRNSFIWGMVLASFIRYLSHGISGVVIWGEFAGEQNVWLYSFILYNLPYMASSLALCLILGLAVYKQHIWDYGLKIS